MMRSTKTLFINSYLKVGKMRKGILPYQYQHIYLPIGKSVVYNYNILILSLKLFQYSYLLLVSISRHLFIYLCKNFASKWMVRLGYHFWFIKIIIILYLLKELLLLLSFFVRWYLTYSPVRGEIWSAVAFYFAAKLMQGLWLLILTQSHHLSFVLMTNIKTGYHIRYSCINKVIQF